jgi:hypothetical protein
MVWNMAMEALVQTVATAFDALSADIEPHGHSLET